MFGRRREQPDSLWINPRKTRSLKERETAASGGPYEARRVPGHLDEFRIVDTTVRRDGDRDAGRTLRYSRSRSDAERIIRDLSDRRKH